MVHKPDGQRPASGEQFRRAVDKISTQALKLVKAVRFRLNELNRELDDAGIPPPFLDQYPGKCVPFAYSKLYGPITQVTVTNINPGLYTLPRKGNIIVSSTQRFHWCRTGAFYCAGNTSSATDIFNPVQQTGGGVLLSSIGFNNTIDFDIELYDRTRSRKLTDAPLPISVFTGGQVVNKSMTQMTTFEPGTEIEPRLFPRRQTSTTPAYVNLVFFGFIEELQ